MFCKIESQPFCLAGTLSIPKLLDIRGSRHRIQFFIDNETGVDFDSYKNMVGAFHMPKLVYMNLSVLKTLSNRQFCSGMGEIIKHGLIKNANYFTWFKENEAQIAALDLPTV